MSNKENGIQNTGTKAPISISGTPPQFDQAALDKRCSDYETYYKSTSVCCVEVRADNPRSFLEAVVAQHDLGFKLNTNFPINLDHLSPSCLFTKPMELQEEELKASFAKLKLAYVDELELEHQSYKIKLIQQLKQADDKKLAEQQAVAEAKRMEAYRAKADACYSPLVIPKD